jgi:flagellar hook protein FlgE
MGLYSMMRTSSSGMNAQANRLATVADNIGNSSTVGYKRASTEFSTILLQSGTADYTSGSVETEVRYHISEQGSMRYSTSATDLAVSGQGFFVVENSNGQSFFTRAGSFVKDGDGNLVNAGGFKLMGYDLALGSTPAIVANGVTGLVPVNIGSFSLKANPSTEGNLYFNLPSNDAVVVAANLPAANAATAEYSGKTSLVTYDLLGNEVTLDIYAAKSAAGAWQISVFDKANAAANGGFPYSAAAITSATLTFDSSGQLTTSSPTELSFTIPNGAAFTLDLSKSVQLATEYSVLSAAVNGNAPGSVQSVDIDDDGTLYAVFDNGQRLQAYKIPLANVPSPDKLKPEPGNVYSLGVDSGDMLIGFAGAGGFGSISSGALEQSTVDLATELTTMIESQREYTANSKVFQTGADLMDVLVNLKR